jgi:hypothetical protein
MSLLAAMLVQPIRPFSWSFLSIGTATIQASVGTVKATTTIDVVRNPVRELSLTPKTTRVRTGDVVRFETVAPSQANTCVSMRYWKDGLVILDVGNGIKGGRPEHPQFVSQLAERRADAKLAGE